MMGSLWQCCSPLFFSASITSPGLTMSPLTEFCKPFRRVCRLGLPYMKHASSTGSTRHQRHPIRGCRQRALTGYVFTAFESMRVKRCSYANHGDGKPAGITSEVCTHRDGCHVNYLLRTRSISRYWFHISHLTDDSEY